MKTLMKVAAVFLAQLTLCLLVFAQPIPPGGGGSGSGTNEPYDWTPRPYVPGLKMNISLPNGANFQLSLLEADLAGKYDIYFATNLISAPWNDVLQGANGQTNFTLSIPVSQSGFFRVARTDQAVADAAGISFYFLNGFVNSNITLAAVEGGVAAATAILVNSTNFAGATWIPFSSMPLVDIGTNEGTHEVWFGFRGTNGIVFWTSDTITLDRTPPSIVITNPVLTTTSRPIIQIQGYSTEPLSDIYFDVTNAAGSVTNQQGFVTAQSFDTNNFNATTNWFQCFDVELTNGVNTITVHAADLAGNVTTTNVIITLDFTGDPNPPVITVTWPQDGAQISGTNFTLRGALDDETAQITAQTVDINGVTNIVSGVVERNGTFWLEDLLLNPGTNLVAIVATDAAGNASVTNLTLFQSSVTFAINPVSDDQLNQPATTVSGTVSDPSYDVWINGVQAIVDGSGNWTVGNVPVYGNGTATFDAIAYPPGQSPNLRMKMNANNNQSPVQKSQASEQPAIIYISEYHDSWSEDEGDYGHWANSKNYNAQVDNNGHFSYNGQATSNGDLDPSLEWWWELTYNWSDADPGGTATETEDEEGDIETASGPGCNPLTGYWYIPDGNSVPSVSWDETSWPYASAVSHYYANINYDWDWPSYGEYDHYNRSSQTFLKLKTGGKSGITRKNLFVISARATEYGRPASIDWGNGPDEWYNTPANGIDSTRIRVLGKNLGNDGNLYIVLPDNAPLDLGAVAPGRHYTLGAGATKHKLTITANDNDLETTTPEFCVGQSVTFSPSWSPSNPGAVSTVAHWHLPDKYVNEAYQYSSTCTSYRKNSDLLTNLTTQCWYVNGNGGACSMFEILHFSNGQYVNMAAAGNFTVVRPTIDHMTNSCSGVNMFTNSDGSLNEIALEGTDKANGMIITISVKRPDHFSGSAFITQLIKRQLNWNIPPLGISWSDSTSGNFWLDTEEQYSLSLTSFPLTENGHAANPVRPVTLYDSPGLGKPTLGFYSYAEAQDDFHDYVRFQPDGGIPITIGCVDWGWHGKATKSSGVWSLVTATDYGPTLDSSDDSFPTWPYTYTGTSGN